jgi:hypothetical protein
MKLLLFISSLFFMGFSFSQKDKTTLTIQFEHFVGKDTLTLDSMNYKNELGQSFTIQNSNIT